MQLAEMDWEIDEAWKKAHLAAQEFERAGSQDAAERYNSAFLRFQYLVGRRMAINSRRGD